MSQDNSYNYSKTIIGLTSLLVLYAGFWCYLFSTGMKVWKENAPLESSQAMGLSLAALFFLILCTKLFLKKDEIEGGNVILLLYSGLFTACLHGFLREVDIERICYMPDFIVMIGSGIGRNIILGVLWLTIVVFSLINFKDFMSKLGYWLRTSYGIAFVLGCLFYLSSGLFDHELFGLDHKLNVFLEELVEGIGSLYILLSSMLSLKYFKV